MGAMNVSEDEYPNFAVDENDLFNFEKYCDKKYEDPTVQKFGFFLVHMKEEVAGQCSPAADFFKMFGAEARIKETVIIDNPINCGLYGHQQAEVSNKHREKYLNLASESLQAQAMRPTCCSQVLEKGVEAYLEHFDSFLRSSSVHWHDKIVDITQLRRKVPKLEAVFKKRQEFQKKKGMAEKREALNLSIQLEKFEECDPDENCHCDVCIYSKVTVVTNETPTGLLYCAGVEETVDKYLYLTKNFAMSHLCHKNMLCLLDSAFGGISFPALYLGKAHSLFPLHIEDLSLWSFNFLYKGFPKFWLIVPPYAVAHLSNALSRCGFGAYHKTCRNNLSHKFFLALVKWFKDEKIPFSVVFQREGHGIVILPNAAHMGGNTGTNLAEACNFGTKSWVPYGCVYPACPCMDDPVHVDVGPLVAVFRRDILKEYLGNNLLHAVQDDYFRKSTVFAMKGLPSQEPLAPSTSSFKNADRKKCPICPVSWTVYKRISVMNHLLKYHPTRVGEEFVVKFLEATFPKYCQNK